MIDYLHVLVRVEDDGSLRALAAFSDKQQLEAYRDAAGFVADQVRLDFFNGPFRENMEVIYAGHRHWNMDSFQLAGYYSSEGDAWNEVSQEGYVSVLRIDTTFEQEQELKKQALERYKEVQKKWRLASYDDLVKRQGAEKTNANLMLRFYEDALESFKPKTRRDIRALYALAVILLLMPIAGFYAMQERSKWGENLTWVSWLPRYASNVSYYRSQMVDVYEFGIDLADFKTWATTEGFDVKQIEEPQRVSRYRAYLPREHDDPPGDGGPPAALAGKDFQEWQRLICAEIRTGLMGRSPEGAVVVYDPKSRTAYYEYLKGL